MPPENTASLSTRALRSAFWAYGSYVFGRLLVLVSTAILARLLGPDEFGLVALALTFTVLLDTVKDLGVSQALIVAPDDEVEERAKTAFLVTVGLGVALFAATAAIAPFAAAFFDEPELTAIIVVLGFNFVLRALGYTHYALAQKRLDFRARTLAEFADVLVRGAAGIGLAVAGFGAWSLVLGYLIGSFALTTTLWVVVRWRPARRGRRSHLRALLGFGGTVTGVDILSAVMMNADYFFIGKVLGTAELGLYTIGYRLPELLVLNLSVVAGLVLFPAFATLSREAMASAYLTSLRYVLMIALPLAVGLAVLAEPLTLALFGDTWEDSVPAMRVLTLFALGVTIAIPAGTAYKALERADILLKLSVPRTFAVVGSIALFVDEGIVAVALCQAGVTIVFELIGLVIASHMLRVSLRQIVVAVWPPVVGAAAIAAAVFPLERALEGSWLTLLAGASLGAVVYVGLLWLVARESLERLVRMARPRLGAGA